MKQIIFLLLIVLLYSVIAQPNNGQRPNEYLRSTNEQRPNRQNPTSGQRPNRQNPNNGQRPNRQCRSCSTIRCMNGYRCKCGACVRRNNCRSCRNVNCRRNSRCVCGVCQ
jgi:hypothetical protein